MFGTKCVWADDTCELPAVGVARITFADGKVSDWPLCAKHRDELPEWKRYYVRFEWQPLQKRMELDTGGKR